LNNKNIVGIDIGTTNIKGSIYGLSGERISSSSYSYKSYSPEEGFHEQNPDEWVSVVIKILKDLNCKIKPEGSIEAICLSTQGGTVVPVDADFNPLCRAITWLDRRSAGLTCEDETLSGENIDFYNKTGWRLDTNMSFMPLYWLKKNNKKIFDRIDKVLFVNDYVLKKITGNNIQDPSNASISLFYNIAEKKWDRGIMNLLNFNTNNFSEVKESGELAGFINEETRKATGITTKVKVINGGHDQYCAGIGAGIFNEEDILLATGTAWVTFKMLNSPIFDPKYFFAVGRNIIKDKFGLIYSIPAAGASIKWYSEKILNQKNEKDLFRTLEKKESKILNLKNNVIFYPYLTGNYGPDFRMDVRASFFNLEIGHDFLDLVKSIMEGVGFQLKKILNLFWEKGIKIKNIKMVGGGAKSNVWPQIIADITGYNVLIPVNINEDFAVKGAAILAGYGTGIFKTIKHGYEVLKSDYKIVKPIKENVDFYNNKFKLFCKYSPINIM
jgi:xylulokinase